MPEPTSEPACTAAIDLLDVRCRATSHPHRGSHYATGSTVEGDHWTLFWSTPRSDRPEPLAPAVVLTAEQVQNATPRSLTKALRRQRRAQL